MATSAKIGYGTLLKVGDGGSPTELFTTLNVEVTSITPFGYTREAIDATHMQSADSFKDYIAGLMDAGEVSIELSFIPSASDPVVAALVAGAQNYQILFPSIATFTFRAICTSYSPTAPVDGKMSASAAFKISGKPTWASV